MLPEKPRCSTLIRTAFYFYSRSNLSSFPYLPFLPTCLNVLCHWIFLRLLAEPFQVESTGDFSTYPEIIVNLSTPVMSDGSCTGPSLQAVSSTLQRCTPYSTMFVFTDTRPSDDDLLRGVIQLAHAKKSRVRILISRTYFKLYEKFFDRHSRWLWILQITFSLYLNRQQRFNPETQAFFRLIMLTKLCVSYAFWLRVFYASCSLHLLEFLLFC